MGRKGFWNYEYVLKIKNENGLTSEWQLSHAITFPAFPACPACPPTFSLFTRTMKAALNKNPLTAI